MKNILVIVDMQNDFISGDLGSEDALQIAPKIADYANSFDGDIFFTLDTHKDDYLEKSEGKNLPIKHCIFGTHGYEICNELKNVSGTNVLKNTFGSLQLAELISQEANLQKDLNITLVGVCTDICVVSNALILKAYMPEAKISVISSLCAGSTRYNHQSAIDTMRSCQVNIIEWVEL